MTIESEYHHNFIDRFKQIKIYPFSLLLCLEWILLGSAILGEFPDSFLERKFYQPSTSVFSASVFSFLCLLGFGLMGLRLPRKNTLYKWLYVILQLGLIWLPIVLNQQVTPLLSPFLIVVMRNCLIFQSRECWVANILVFISLIPSLTFISNFQEFQSMLSKYQVINLEQFETFRDISNISFLFFNGLLIAFIWILVNALLREYKSQQQLAIAHEQLRQYALKIEDQATLQERNRIAREIHDSVGHALTAQTIQLNNAIAFWQTEPAKAYQFLTEAKTLVTTALQDIRHSVSTLRADPLQGKSLESAIALLIQEFSQRTKIIPQYTTSFTYPLSEEIKMTVYRIMQEALTNIAKHSDATEVMVNLQTLPEYLQLIIKDNGKGFNPQQNTTGFGLQGMRERIAALGGYLEISSQCSLSEPETLGNAPVLAKRNRGCTIMVKIDYQPLM